MGMNLAVRAQILDWVVRLGLGGRVVFTSLTETDASVAASLPNEHGLSAACLDVPAVARAAKATSHESHLQENGSGFSSTAGFGVLVHIVHKHCSLCVWVGGMRGCRKP